MAVSTQSTVYEKRSNRDHTASVRQIVLSQPEIISYKSKRWILALVFLAHVVVLMIPFAWQFFKKQPRVEKTLTVSTISAAMVLKKSHQTAQHQDIKIPEVSFKPIPELPPIPEPPQNRQPQVTPTPPKIPQTRQPTPQPTTPKKTYLSPDQIKVSREVVRVTTQQQRQVNRNIKVPDIKQINVNDLQQLKNQISQSQVSAVSSSSNLRSDSNYNLTVSAFLKEQWTDMPTLIELNGTSHSVKIQIRIESDGQISRYQIMSSTGNQPTIQSLQRLLSRIRRVPRPPQGSAPYLLIVNFNAEQ